MKNFKIEYEGLVISAEECSLTEALVIMDRLFDNNRTEDSENIEPQYWFYNGDNKVSSKSWFYDGVWDNAPEWADRYGYSKKFPSVGIYWSSSTKIYKWNDSDPTEYRMGAGYITAEEDLVEEARREL